MCLCACICVSVYVFVSLSAKVCVFLNACLCVLCVRVHACVIVRFFYGSGFEIVHRGVAT